MKAPHSKCGIRATVSGVRIPPSPPSCFAPLALRRILRLLPDAGVKQDALRSFSEGGPSIAQLDSFTSPATIPCSARRCASGGRAYENCDCARRADALWVRLPSSSASNPRLKRCCLLRNKNTGKMACLCRRITAFVCGSTGRHELLRSQLPAVFRLQLRRIGSRHLGKCIRDRRIRLSARLG